MPLAAGSWLRAKIGAGLCLSSGARLRQFLAGLAAPRAAADPARAAGAVPPCAQGRLSGRPRRVLEQTEGQLAREGVDLDQLDPYPVAERERGPALLPDQGMAAGS